MTMIAEKRHVVISLGLHLAILTLLVFSFDRFSEQRVFENTPKQEAISAVILGDTPKSSILPTPKSQLAPKPEPKPLPLKPQTPAKAVAKQEAVAIKPVKKTPPAPIKKVVDNKTIAKEKLAKQKLATKNKFEQLLKARAEETLRQQMLAEKIKLDNKIKRETQGIVDKYAALIQQAIAMNWLVPPGANKKLTTEVMIRLAVDGKVIEVQVTKTSGDAALDSSIRVAVFKSSPLPVPSNKRAFAEFRQFVMRFKPENILDTNA